MSSHPQVMLKPVPQSGSKLPTYPHMIKRNSNLLAEVFTEQWDLGISLTEVIEHDELCIHLHPSLNSLGGRAAKGRGTWHRIPWSDTGWLALPLQHGRADCFASKVTSHQKPTLHLLIYHLLGTRRPCSLQARPGTPSSGNLHWWSLLTSKQLRVQESSCNYLELYSVEPSKLRTGAYSNTCPRGASKSSSLAL